MVIGFVFVVLFCLDFVLFELTAKHWSTASQNNQNNIALFICDRRDASFLYEFRKYPTKNGNPLLEVLNIDIISPS